MSYDVNGEVWRASVEGNGIGEYGTDFDEDDYDDGEEGTDYDDDSYDGDDYDYGYDDSGLSVASTSVKKSERFRQDHGLSAIQ